MTYYKERKVVFASKVGGRILDPEIDLLDALEPSSSLDNRKINIYEHQEDAWKVAIAEIPVDDFTDSESLHRTAGHVRKLHEIIEDADNETVVVQFDLKKHIFKPRSNSVSSEATTTIYENHWPLEAAAHDWEV